MRRNVIAGLAKVDWSDPRRQNEFVHSVISALGGLGHHWDYDYVCAVSGSAFRTSFSVTGLNHGNYHAVHVPCIIEHTFRVLGYQARHYTWGDYERDKRLVVESIDRGVPVVTLEGVINCADACVIAGYDDGGDVLLGYSPFMYIPDDHQEPHDATGHFRKSHWHEGYCAGGSRLRILAVGEERPVPTPEESLAETLALAVRLVETGSMAEGQHNGLAAHRAFANALLTYPWEDNFEPYLNVMCNYKQYLDRQYAAKYLRSNGRPDLAKYYEEIAALCAQLGRLIPQDFSACDLFSDREKLRPYADTLLRIHDLEAAFAHRAKQG